MSVIAERAFTSRSTLQRIEAGDPGSGSASMGRAAILGASGELANAVDLSRDSVGQALAAAALPKRVRQPRMAKSDA